ncbi:hypothetical protein D3C71_2111470 [compost metagenome]
MFPPTIFAETTSLASLYTTSISKVSTVAYTPTVTDVAPAACSILYLTVEVLPSFSPKAIALPFA